MVRVVMALSILGLACSPTQSSTAGPQSGLDAVEETSVASRRIGLTRLPALGALLTAEEAEGHWVLGGVRLIANEGRITLAEESLSSPILLLTQVHDGWLFATRHSLWRADSFLGPIHELGWHARPESMVRTSAGLLLVINGRAHLSTGRFLNPIAGLEELWLSELHSVGAVVDALDVTGLCMQSLDGGITWREGTESDQRPCSATSDEEEDEEEDVVDDYRERRLFYFQALAAVLTRYPLLAQASGIHRVADGWLVSDDAPDNKRFLPNAGPSVELHLPCESHDLPRTYPFVLCSDALYQLENGMASLVRSFPHEVDTAAAIFGVDEQEFLFRAGCSGEPARVCLVSRRTGEQREFRRVLGRLHRPVLVNGRVLSEQRDAVVMSELETGLAAVVAGCAEGRLERWVVLPAGELIHQCRAADNERSYWRTPVGGEPVRLEFPGDGEFQIQMVDDAFGVANELDGGIFYTDDGGRHWSRSEEASEPRGDPGCHSGGCMIGAFEFGPLRRGAVDAHAVHAPPRVRPGEFRFLRCRTEPGSARVELTRSPQGRGTRITVRGVGRDHRPFQLEGTVPLSHEETLSGSLLAASKAGAIIRFYGHTFLITARWIHEVERIRRVTASGDHFVAIRHGPMESENDPRWELVSLSTSRFHVERLMALDAEPAGFALRQDGSVGVVFADETDRVHRQVDIFPSGERANWSVNMRIASSTSCPTAEVQASRQWELFTGTDGWWTREFGDFDKAVIDADHRCLVAAENFSLGRGLRVDSNGENMVGTASQPVNCVWRTIH